MASITPKTVEQLRQRLDQSYQIYDTMANVDKRKAEDARDRGHMNILMAEHQLMPLAQQADAEAEYKQKAAEARAKGQEPPPMPRETPVSTQGYSGTIGPSELFNVANQQVGGGPPPASNFPSGGAAPIPGGPQNGRRDNILGGAPENFRGPQAPPGLPQQGPLPDAPAMIGTLEVSRGTRQEQLGGPLGPYVPRATENVSMRATPNVLSAAERATLEQRRFEYQNDYALNQTKVRGALMGDMLRTFANPQVGAYVADRLINGTLNAEDLKNAKTFMGIQSEEEHQRTLISEGQLAVNRYTAISNAGYQAGMLNVARTAEARMGWATFQGAIDARMGRLIQIADLNQDAHFRQSAMDLQVLLQDNALNMQDALNRRDDNRIRELHGDSLRLQQTLARLEQDGLNMRQQESIKADNNLLKMRINQEKWKTGVDFQHEVAITGLRGQIDVAKSEQEFEQNRILGREARTQNYRNEYAMLVDKAAFDRSYQRQGHLQEMDRQQLVLQVSRDMKIDEAAANMQVQQWESAAHERLQQLQDQSKDKDRALELYRQESLNNSGADMRDIVRSRDFMNASAQQQKDVLDRYKAETDRAGKILPFLDKLSANGQLTPTSMNFGEMGGFDRSKVSGANLSTDIERLKPGKGESVDTAADPGQFYDVAMRVATLHDRVAGIDKNGLQFLRGNEYAGLLAVARGMAPDASPALVSRATQKLKDMNLVETVNGILVPKQTGATAAWANDAWRTFDQSIVGHNSAYMNAGFQSLGLKPYFRDTGTGEIYQIPGSVVTPEPGGVRRAIGESLGRVADTTGGDTNLQGLLLGEMARIMKGSKDDFNLENLNTSRQFLQPMPGVESGSSQ